MNQMNGRKMMVSEYFKLLNGLCNSFSSKYPFLNEIYTEYLNACNKANGGWKGEGEHETFKQDVINQYGDFYLVWDIERWKSGTIEGTKEVKTVDYLYSLLSPETIKNIDVVKSRNLPDEALRIPLILVPWEYSSGKYLLIDGHHRLLRQRELEIKDADVCVLSEQESIEIMTSQRYQALYCVTTSIIRLNDFLNGKIKDCTIFRFNDILVPFTKKIS
ncbi:hypothetical protein ABER68_05000 [Paenibacillus alvei]